MRVCLYFISFASVFHLLRLSSGALSLLSSACPLACLVCSCVLVGFCVCCCFFFPCGLYAKERAQSVFASSLRGLWAFYILVQLLRNSVAVALAFSSSFGLYSQLIQQESDGLPVRTLIFSGIMSIQQTMFLPFLNRMRSVVFIFLACCGLLYLVAALYSSNSSGVSPLTS